jgi:FkbM family methyltransferase
MTLAIRHWIWRAGRRMYMWARNDEPNDMSSNGELRLQRLVIEGLADGRPLIAFDVGARIGDWSRGLIDNVSGRAGGCRIHVFEPVPESRRTLEELFAEQIRQKEMLVNSTALSDKFGPALIYVPHVRAGTSTLHPDSRIIYEAALEVSTNTVDEYCRQTSVDRIDLLKIDTEGGDLRVIRGALGLLRAGNIGVLQFEYNFRWIHSRSYLKDVFDLISDTPYRVAKVCSSALEIYDQWHPELERYFETNYALVHERLTASLDCRLLTIGRGNACEIDAGDRAPNAGQA